jgi:hypothetical protein
MDAQPGDLRGEDEERKSHQITIGTNTNNTTNNTKTTETPPPPQTH